MGTQNRSLINFVVCLLLLAVIASAGFGCAGLRDRQRPISTPLETSEPLPPTTPTPTYPPVQPTEVPTLTVPEEYRGLYEELDAALTHFEHNLNQEWSGQQGQTIFATELAFANGNVGEGLLLPQILDANRILLDRLQELGVKGVVLSIKYPLLQPDFPRSAEYLEFYKDIAAECRQRDMKILVETGAIFSGTDYSPVKVDWSKYTTESFLNGMRDQLLLIANEIKPDYLTLTEEPTTQEALTGLTIAPGLWTGFVNSILDEIDPSSGIQVGAGMGSWENRAYIDDILQMPRIDYIDLHIYPLGKDGVLLDRVLDIVQDAHDVGKSVTIGECWLYKATPEEIVSGPGIDGNVFNRDPFSFWYPLDARFFDIIINIADATNMEFVSFFWTRYLFAYVDYSAETGSLSIAEMNRRINQAANANVKEGILSPLGQHYQQQLSSRTTHN
ncbi:MAG: hypothetical protein JSV54_07160 [Chloroflexota bacterium]|nr:MAG: hypothetical protein JSV54_07160 [Chloroflexota bacterium]